MVLIAAIFPILGDDSDCRGPVFAPADAVADPTKVRIFFESNALLPVFLSGGEQGRDQFILLTKVNTQAGWRRNRACDGWFCCCNMLSNSSLRGNWGLLIDVHGVLGDCYFVTLLHVTCYIKRYAIREKEEKNWSKNSIYKIYFIYTIL